MELLHLNAAEEFEFTRTCSVLLGSAMLRQGEGGGDMGHLSFHNLGKPTVVLSKK